MEKNIAAFLDDKAYTVHVQFVDGDQSYTYVTNFSGINVGDAVIVPIIGARRRSSVDLANNPQDSRVFSAKIGTVTRIDAEVNLPTDDTREYSWIIQRVDFAAYEQVMIRNNAIVEAVTDAYKKNLRRSFADRILGEMADGPKTQLLTLLGKAPAEPPKSGKLDYATWLEVSGRSNSGESMDLYEQYYKG